MSKSIEAMKVISQMHSSMRALISCLAASKLSETYSITIGDAYTVLKQADTLEEAQTVEPVAWMTQVGVLVKDNNAKSAALYGWTPLFTRPAPQPSAELGDAGVTVKFVKVTSFNDRPVIKQPLSTEREAMEQELRSGWNVLADDWCEVSRLDDLCQRAANMLAADAHEIAELEFDYTNQALRAIEAEEKLSPQLPPPKLGNINVP